VPLGRVTLCGEGGWSTMRDSESRFISSLTLVMSLRSVDMRCTIMRFMRSWNLQDA
jgi:hypothetical protein